MTKKKKPTIESNSYMEMEIHLDGEESLTLRVPTFWNDIEKQWIGTIQTPKTRKIISASGKNSFELQNNFNKEMSVYLHNAEDEDEVFDLFCINM